MQYQKKRHDGERSISLRDLAQCWASGPRKRPTARDIKSMFNKSLFLLHGSEMKQKTTGRNERWYSQRQEVTQVMPLRKQIATALGVGEAVGE
ncbi:12490_t:CDS:2 [Ambispora gerdemannii]|uniref:12490_t:CDS:1 n=1 Tax=Ambispora gerdemannii TaxID=144530 RepID=A0A9N8V204_9GLOM|nr:12490_t:CDS:2 [Ambispora gerdemannii]